MGENLSLQVFMSNGLFPFLYCDASLSPLSSSPLPLAIKSILAAHLEGWKREREGVLDELWAPEIHKTGVAHSWSIYTMEGWGGGCLSMCFCLPVREVSPMQPAAMMTPNTAAASSSSTTLVLGSRLCITAHTKQCKSTVNSGIFKPCACTIHQFRICSNNCQKCDFSHLQNTIYTCLICMKKKITAVWFEQSHFKPYQIPACASEDNVTFT